MTKTNALVEYLRQHGPTAAAKLAKETGLPDSGRVTALLKARIQSGQVERSGKRWALNEDWDDLLASDLRDARIMLERAGYTVVRHNTQVQP